MRCSPLALLLLAGCMAQGSNHSSSRSISPGDTGDLDTGTLEDTTACLTLRPWFDGTMDVLRVDLDTGEVRVVDRLAAGVPGSFHTFGMTWFDGALVLPAYDGNGFSWLELAVTGGGATWGGDVGHGDAVTTDGEQLLTASIRDNQLCAYDSFSDLASGAGPSTECVTTGNYGHSVSWSDGLLYGTWHAGDRVGVYDPETGELLDEILLSRWDTWFAGISVVGGYIHVIDDGRGEWDSGDLREVRLARYDMSGVLVNDVLLPGLDGDHGRPTGVWCWEG